MQGRPIHAHRPSAPSASSGSGEPPPPRLWLDEAEADDALAAEVGSLVVDGVAALERRGRHAARLHLDQPQLERRRAALRHLLLRTLHVPGHAANGCAIHNLRVSCGGTQT
eukprot:1314972-Pleurochrysis_carterae.AAC.4